MDEKQIQQVLQIEKDAQEVYDAAVREAQQLPVQAEQEGQALIVKAREAARVEAEKILAQAQDEQETRRVLDEAEKHSKDFEALAKKNFDRAVNLILDRVAGGK